MVFFLPNSGEVNIMVLGTAEQIQEKINQALILVKEEKNNDVRLALYNYIGN